ncbi:MAG: InlB B-repeat-containing protein [Bacteroidia bacterium]|nr:InlB B-repeat-containing protein [Bacteroidia bacterium]
MSYCKRKSNAVTLDPNSATLVNGSRVFSHYWCEPDTVFPLGSGTFASYDLPPGHAKLNTGDAIVGWRIGAGPYAFTPYTQLAWSQMEAGNPINFSIASGNSSHLDKSKIDQLLRTNNSIYPIFNSTRFGISFDLDGGVWTGAAPSGITYAFGAAPTFNPGVGRWKNGYATNGWQVRRGILDFVDIVDYNLPPYIAGPLTLTALWEPIVYNITYIMNGGSGCSNTTYTVETETFNLCTSASRTGYTFGGWYKEAALINKVTEVPKGSTNHKTFYAKWHALNYNITYYLNGGTNNSNNKTSYTIETETFNLLNPSRENYDFAGWYDNANFTGNPITQIVQGSTGHRSFYAKWVPTVYTISYVDGGGCAEHAYTVESGETTLCTSATRSGYTFKGWYDNPSFNGSSTTQIPAGSAGNKTFYAKWEAINYSITYYLDGGSSNPDNPVTYNIETNTFDLFPSSKMGYNFDGWYANSNFSGDPVAQIVKGSTGNKTFYAKWEIITYNITYDLKGGLGCSNRTYTIESETITLCVPTKTGYAFDGWYDVNNKVTNIPAGSIGDRSYYAKWNIINYNITYNMNGGSGCNNTIYTVESGLVNLCTNVSRIGYTFKGWYDNASFNGNPIIQIPAGSVGNKIFYAKWEIITYNIAYNLNGGSSHPDNLATYNIETNTFNLLPSSKVGYNFDGWYDSNNNKVTQITKGSVGDITLSARWSLVTYNITYNMSGGLGCSNRTYTIESETVVLCTTIEKTGYTFDGWYTNSNFSGGIVTEISKGSTGNKTFYAKWGAVTYDITYHLGGGTNHGSNPLNYTIEQVPITLQNASRAGYSFEGWYKEESFINKVTNIPAGSTGNKTFYAKWSVVDYNIIYYLNGGTNPSSNKDGYTVEQLPSTLHDASRPGYAFKGWYDNVSFNGNPITQIPAGSTGNKIFYAKWEIITYNVTYNMNEGNGCSDRTYTVETPTFNLCTSVSRTGYWFKGWYDNAGFNGNPVTQVLKGSTGNKIFYAKWQKRAARVVLYNKYIQYKTGKVHEVNVNPNPTKLFEYDEDIIINLSNMALLDKKKGSIWSYRFIGWTKDGTRYTDDAYNTPSYSYIEGNNNITHGLGKMGSLPNAVDGTINNEVYYAVWERYKSGIKKNNKDLVIYKGDTKLKKITKGSVIIWEKPK